jgi:hypothetical protein
MEQYPGQAVQTHRRIVIEGTSSDKVLTDGKQSPLLPQQLYGRRRSARRLRRMFLLLPPLCLLLGLALGGAYALWWSTATIHLRPMSATQDALITVTAVLRRAGPNQSQLHLLTSSQTSPTVSVQPSGRTQRAATRATGMLTWNNQEPYQQTIPAGTILTSAAGVQVVTDGPVVIGAGAPPYSGVAYGSASANGAGAGGNIPAGAIDLLCGACGPGITVKNADPFSGGQDAATLAILEQGDIDQATAPLKTRLSGLVLQALQAMVPPTEKTVSAPSCAPRLHVDHQPGDRLALGTAVPVSLTETCSETVYDPGDAQSKAISQFLANVAGRYPASQFSASIAATPRQLSVLEAGWVVLPFLVHGHWVYRISPEEQRALLRQIAGQPQQQALQILTRSPGVRQASIEQPIPWFSLPTDPRRIAIVPLSSSAS